MSFLDSVRNAGSNFVGGIDDIVDFGEDVVSTTIDAADTVGDTFAAGVNVTQDLAVSGLRFQADLTRAGLERAWDGAQTVGSTTRNLFEAGFDRISRPGDPTPPDAQGLKFSETKSAAGLAYDAELGDVYRFPDGGEWEVVDVEDDSRAGFRAIALRSTDTFDDRVIVAFAGSREGVDWANNIGQGLGLPTPQYNQAVNFAEKWQEREGDNVILTGHSLGGGLASYASLQTGLHATAVNSAPLALNHLGLNPFAATRITQYYVPGEALSVLNSANPLDARPGMGIAVEGEHSIFDPRSIGRNHSLDAVAPDIPAPVKIN